MKKFLLLSFLLLSLFCYHLFALTESELISNLNFSLQLSERLENQLNLLVQDYQNRDLLLTSLQTDNSQLRLQLTTLETQLSQQTETLSNLSMLNQTLMETQEQLLLQVDNSEIQLNSLSEELRKSSWNSLKYGILGVVGGIVVGGIVGYLIAK